MPAKATKKKESTNLEERIKALEDVSHVPQDYKEQYEELEEKIEALYDGLRDMKRILDRVKERMGL